MAKVKFKVGDKVRLTGRVPAYIKPEVSNRTHTIKSVQYDSRLQTTLYELSGVGRGTLAYLFRGYMLKHVSKAEMKKVGRPRTKRSYKRRK